jgi:hypothetical protein
MTDLNPQPLPPRSIRVQVPHEILNDLERFQKVQARILGRVGCPACTSGFQFDWHNYENWAVDQMGRVQPLALGAAVSEIREG